MNDDTTPTPLLEEWDDGDFEDFDDYDDDPTGPDSELPGPPRPVNWNLLRSHELEQEWLALNRWVEWLRRTYALPPSVIPPLWHRHEELKWELSALHLHWLCAYDPEQDGSAPLGWHRDFAAARQRLRDWVAASGTRLDRDRSSRQTAWPGEPPAPAVEDIPITNRRADFVRFVIEEVAKRKAAEEAAFARFDDMGGGER